MASNNEGSEERTEKTPDRPRGGRWAVRLLIVLLIGVAAAVYWRQPLAGMILRAALDRAGFAGAELTVSDLSLSSARLRAVRLGPELAIGKAETSYDLSRLPGNPITSIALDGVRIDLTGPNGPLRHRLEARPAGAAPTTLRTLIERAAGLPAVSIRDLSLRAAPTRNVVKLGGSVEASPQDGGYALRYDMTLAGELGGDARTLALDGTARIAADALTLKAGAKTGDAAAGASLEVHAAIGPDTALLDGKGAVTVRDPSSLAGILPQLDGTAGEISLSLRTSQPVPVGLDAPLDRLGPAASVRLLEAGGIRLEAAVRNGSHPAGVEGADGSFTLTLQGDPDKSQGMRGEGRLSLTARQVVVAPVTAEAAEVAGAFRIRRQDDTVTLVLTSPLKIAAANIRSEDNSAIVAPVALSLSGGRTHALRLTLDDAGTVDGRLRMAVGAATAQFGDAFEREVRVAPFILRLAGTADRAGAANAAFRIGKFAVTEAARTGTAEGVVMTVKRSGTSTTANLRGRVSAQEKGTPLLQPVLIQSDLSLWRDILAFDAKAILPGLSVATAKGKADLFAGTGTAALSLPSFRVTPGGGEVRALVPSLSGFDIRSGTLQASADLNWSESGIDGTADIAVRGTDFSHTPTGTTVQGLEAAIRFDRLAAPRTPDGQSLRAVWVNAGISFDNPALRFALVDGAAPDVPAVKVDSFDTGFAGGRLSIAPTVLDSAAGTGKAVIAVDKVDLAALLGAIGLEGVSGTGRLSGTVPVGIVDGAVVVSGGRLDAAGPGVLRIRSEAAKTALAGGGAEVALMLSALEDFRYETLSLEVEKEAAGEGRVVLHTRGRNPAVRAGQPFVINLNVSGNVDRLAAVLAQALRLPGELVRSMLPAQP